jgi:predicted TIM-barrel fold metal-dependent hydrolase
MPEAPGSDRYAVISADGHAGGDLWDYEPYLDRQWREEFRTWAAAFVNPFGDRLLSERPNANWDSELRTRLLEDDGIVAEVIFPNTVPPFYPQTQFFVPPPPSHRTEYERRWAGLKAHNRWLADFCAALPGRRAGVAQIMLNDVDDAVREINWVKDAGLFGGILLPGVPPGSGLPGLWSPAYEPIWTACEELDVPINHHSGAGIPEYGDDDLGRTMLHTEVAWFVHRAVWHLTYSGVFERHPRLKFIITEASAGWVPGTLERLDATTERYRMEGSSAHFFGGRTAGILPMRPSDYFARNCFLGASFMHRNEALIRDKIGIEKIMWGGDFPHVEGSYPYSRQALQATFAELPVEDVRRMVSTNAADVYGFDLEVLQPTADRVGPTTADVWEPLDEIPDSWCNAFARRPVYVD